MAVTRSRIEKNLLRIRDEIAGACARCGRNEADVAIIPVTKSVEVDEIRSLVDLGFADLAESRVQQLCERAGELTAYLQRRRTPPHEVRWHMVGHLQRNKVKAVLAYADSIHSVDSLRLAEEINARSEQLGRTVEVLLEVNCSEEPQKLGCAVGAALHLGELVSTLRNLRLVGLMTMAALSDNAEAARATFVRLREVFEEMRGEGVGGAGFRHLSMGMSQDYVVAVEEGATMCRIGTAIFA
jgi:pyridoxal phosphate enzyme (YggS family)